MSDAEMIYDQRSEISAEQSLRQTFVQMAQCATEVSDVETAFAAAAIADLLAVATIFREDSSTSDRANDIVEFCRQRALPAFADMGSTGSLDFRRGLVQEVNSRWCEDLSLLAPEERIAYMPHAEDHGTDQSSVDDSQWGHDPVDVSSNESRPTVEDSSTTGSLNSDVSTDRLHPGINIPQLDIAEILAALRVEPQRSSDRPAAEPISAALHNRHQNAEGNHSDRKDVIALQPVDGHELPAPPDECESIDDPEMEAAYADDALQCLAEMEALLLGLESGHDAEESLRGFCRQLHTLKGASGTVGLSRLAKYLHELENYIEKTHSQKIDVDELLKGVDAVRTQLTALGIVGSGTSMAESSTGSIAESATLATCTTAASTAISPIASTSPISSSPSGDADPECFVRVEASRLDGLMDLLAELVTLRNRRDTYVESLRSIRNELHQCSPRTQGLISTAELSIPTADSSAGMAGPGRPTATSRLLTRTLDEVSKDTAELGRALQETLEPLADDNSTVSQLIGRFRQELMELRRVPISGLFQRLQRAIREAAKSEGKQVEVRFEGQGARADRAVQERLFEPLLHLVRNAVSHGIDTQEARVKAGKSAVGRISLVAWSDAATLCIEVRDDGRGFNDEALETRGRELGLLPRGEAVSQAQLWNLIFQPGFSTKTTVSEISGRGVGMDVVNSWVKRLRGRIDVESKPGQGTTFRLQIPLRSSVEHAMVVRAGGQLFALPMHTVSGTSDTRLPESPSLKADSKAGVIRLSRILGRPGNDSSRGCFVSLRDTLRTQRTSGNSTSNDVIIGVDAIVGVEEVVVRPLPTLLQRHELFAGVTLAGRAETVLLLDVPHILALSRNLKPDTRDMDHQATNGNQQQFTGCEQHILVVDDSVVVRRSLSKRLRAAGCEVSEAANGREAMSLLFAGGFTAIVTDLDMPRMGGVELMGEVKRQRQLRSIPVIVLTSRDDESMPPEVRQLQPTAILNKPITDRTIQAILDALNQFAASRHN